MLPFDTTNTWSACFGSRFPVAAHPGWAGQESRCPQSDLLFMSPWLCKLGHRANVSEGEGEIWRGKKKKQERGDYMETTNNSMAVSHIFPLPPLLLFALHTLSISSIDSSTLQTELDLAYFQKAVKDDTGCKWQHAHCDRRSGSLCVCMLWGRV